MLTQMIDLRALSRTDQVVGGASLIVLISLFLPWFGFSSDGVSYGISGMTAHGFLAIVLILAVLIIVSLLLCSSDKFPVNLPDARRLLIVGTALQFFLVLVGFFDWISGLSWQIGGYLALIASAAAVTAVIMPVFRSWQAKNKRALT